MFLELLQNSSIPDLQQTDISQAYMHGVITENMNTSENNILISQDTPDNPNEYRDLPNNQDSDSNSQYPPHYGLDSIPSPHDTIFK